MRIGIDASFIGTRKPTGLAVYTWNIVNELAKLHDDIILWTADDFGFTIPSDRIRHVMQMWSFLGEKRFMIRPFWMEFILPHLIRREKVDIVFSTVPGGISACQVPHVITVHDIIPLTYPVDHPRSVQWNFKRRLPVFLKNAAAVIADSDYTKQDIMNHYGVPASHVNVVYLGYDAANFYPVDAPATLEKFGLRRGEYIATVGNATFRKNHETLIAALGRVREKIPLRLVFAGPVNPEQESRLRSVARICGVEERICFPGYVPYEDLAALYSGAALFAYISLYEGFGLPVLEAMACGTPVLASNSTSVPEVAGDAALLVDPASADDVARAIQKIATDTGLRDKMIEDGLQRAKAFSWQQSAQEVLRTLTACCQSGGNCGR
jgi:glycosyltransferase involved in cell wall biosynthesis